MPSAIERSRSLSRIVIIIIILVLFVPLCYSIVSGVVSAGSEIDELFLEMPDPKYKECVKDTEYMRYHHWELLRSTREEVVRYGIRSDINLDRCKDCHVNREDFCNKCHDATSLTPDCFDCHYYP